MLEGANVLVVDSSKIVQKIVASILKKDMGADMVILTGSGSEALDTIRKGDTRIDWVISGWELPGVSGYDFLRALRDNPATASIPFIMMTSYDDKDHIVQALEAGVTDYLIKPFTHQRFLDDIQRIISLQRRRKAARYKAPDENPVTIRFADGHEYKGTLMDISKTDCLTRTVVFNKAVTCIYDSARVSISLGARKVEFTGQLFRMEKTPSKKPDGQMFAAFQIVEIDEANKARLSRFIEDLCAQLGAEP